MAAAGLLLAMKRLIREPRLYRPPDDGDTPPRWVRGVLLATCGGVSLAHGSNVHMTYAQGAAAELIAAVTISLADVVHMPVSTTQVLSSGVAGTMWANRSGIRADTVRKIGLAWAMTLPAAITLSATLFIVGGMLIPGARPNAVVAVQTKAPPMATAVAGVHRLQSLKNLTFLPR